MEQTGACRFCGQTQVTGMMTGAEERDSKVTLNCDCPEGHEFRREERMKEKIQNANEQINALFGQEMMNHHIEPLQNQRFIAIMKELAEAAIRSQIRKATIEDEETGTKGYISVNSKGGVNIERGNTFKYKREI